MAPQRNQQNNTDLEAAKRCTANAILDGSHDDYFEDGHVQKTNHYDNMLVYYTEIANGLPQRQAFYTVDLADILWKIEEWKKRLPNVEIFYAVKANVDPVILKLLAMLDLSFDCASEGEIRMVLKAGASPSHIIFAHTIKPEEELKYARNAGVDLMTFDNEEELLKIHRLHPKAKLLLRLSPVNVNCAFDLSGKFGCSEEEAPELLMTCKRLNLEVIGVSFHVGALCKDVDSYKSTIRSCRRIFDKAQGMGYTFTILDIGGGFDGNHETDNLFIEMADGIKEALDEHFSGEGVRVIAEPGCYICASAVSLICTVIGKKVIKNAGKNQPARHYFLNDSIYSFFFRDIEFYGIQLKPLLPESELKSRPVYNSRIYGQTCCSEDVIRCSIILPDLKVGERLVWQNMGAYSRGVASTFCGVPYPIPKYIFVRNNGLNMDWIRDKKSIMNFLEKQTAFIDCEDI